MNPTTKVVGCVNSPWAAPIAIISRPVGAKLECTGGTCFLLFAIQLIYTQIRFIFVSNY